MSSLDHSKLLPSQIPEGWSNEPSRISDVKTVFTSGDYGLSDVTPFLAEKANPRFLLESKGQYYLWNAISDVVVKIEEPVGLEGLLGCLTKWDRIKAANVKRVNKDKVMSRL